MLGAKAKYLLIFKVLTSKLVYMKALQLVNNYLSIPASKRVYTTPKGDEMKKLDLVLTGELAAICGKDRRTVLAREKLGQIERIGTANGKGVYLRSDALKLKKIFEKEDKRIES